MPSQPFVAVIIPTLNEEKFIGACLQSVFEQSYPGELLDILIIDGGSTDKTRTIVGNISQTHPQVRLLDNPHRIQAAAFNIGTQNTTASIVIRLDAHAAYDRVYISRCVERIEANPEIGNVGGIWKIKPGTDTLAGKANAVLNQVSFGIGGAKFRVGAQAGYADTVPFGAFPREVIEKVGGMNEALARGEDNEYNARIREAGYKVYFDPQIISSYFARPTCYASMIQMYKNGRSIGYLLRTYRRAVGLRHIIPAVFVLGIILLPLCSLCIPPLIFLWFAALFIYLAADIAATFSACRQFGYDIALILPPLFFLVHLSYGVGTLYGFITKKL